MNKFVTFSAKKKQQQQQQKKQTNKNKNETKQKQKEGAFSINGGNCTDNAIN